MAGHDAQFERLIGVLHELGVPTTESVQFDCESGFPCLVTLANGSQLSLEVPTPALLASFDPTHVGLAVLDVLGYATAAWGLAAETPHFDPLAKTYVEELKPLISAAYEGTAGSLYFDGCRYFAAPLKLDHRHAVALLVTEASDERHARGWAESHARLAQLFRRVGKALTMNQHLRPLGNAAVHEIASCLELAAVMLWVRRGPEDSLELLASVGANREGASVMRMLDARAGVSCVAELVASRREPIFIRNVHDNLMTAQLEGRFCYLSPGAMGVMPLIVGNRLIGVLELIAKRSDSDFDMDDDMLTAIAEQLSLALNSAITFEQVERLATCDPLTGIDNNRSMREFLSQRLSEAARQNGELGVIMIDVDHFRAFNEEEGHDAGDQVLCRVAETIKSCLRPYDLAARYGGEEFTVVMPGSTRRDTERVAERIRERVAALEYRAPSGTDREITVSLGVAGYPAAAQEATDLLRAADAALYEAKRRGRNCVVLYEPSLTAASRTEILEDDRLIELVDPHLREASMAMADRLATVIEQLGRRMRLSTTQRRALTGAALLWNTYRAMPRAARAEAFGVLSESPHLRHCLGTLEDAQEQVNGGGPKGLRGAEIPLLSRLLRVLVAVDADEADIQGVLDAELLAIVRQAREAA